MKNSYNMYSHGQIVRIKCENVLTYQNIEIFPCPKLNLIIGANGTGKSTIISAIILGLGGNAACVGRATDLKQYVKVGQKQAHIEIELYVDDGNVIIERYFDIKGGSYFRYNGKGVTLEKLEKYVQRFHIQINNLCQILPQEKLELFAKMDDHERLCKTLDTIGSHDLSKKLTFLKTSKEMEATVRQKVANLKNKLIEQQNKKDAMEVEVRTVKEKMFLIECLKLLKQRKEWQFYFHLKQALNLINEAIKSKQADCQKLNNVLKSTMAEIQSSYSTVCNTKETAKETSDQLNANIRSIKSKQNEIVLWTDKVSDIKSGFKQTEKKCKTQECDVRLMKEKIQKIKEEISNAGLLDSQIEAYNMKIHTKEKENRQIEHAQENCGFSLAAKRNELNAVKCKLGKMNDVKEQKTRILQQHHEDCLEGLKWIEKNRHLFRGEVFGPMFLYLNVDDTRNAKYVEMCVNNRDLIAFICELREDTDTLIKELREKRKLRISVVSALFNVSVSDLRSPFPIEELKPLGFHSYVSNLISGPPIIVEYLTMTYRLHHVPVGNAYTYKVSHQIPNEIKVFFTDKYRFSSIVAELTGAKIETSREITEARYLASNTNMRGVEELQELYSRCEHEVRQLEDEYKILHDKVSKADSAIRELRNEKKKLENSKLMQNRLKERLLSEQKELNRLQNTVLDLNVERNKSDLQVKIFLAKVSNAYIELSDLFRSLFKTFIKYQQIKMNIELAEKIHLQNLYTTEELVKSLEEYANSLRELDNKKRKLDQCTRTVYGWAMKSTGRVDPRSAAFKHRKIFFKLTESVAVLDRLITRFQAKVNCLGGANDGLELFREYKELVKDVKFLEKKIAKKEELLQTHFVQKDEIKQKFLVEVRTLIETIDTNFRRFFEAMGCVGMVCLYEGEEGNDDFNKYGIHIKVKFRKQGDLHVLNSQIQSGGERAVSIAIYLLSLQELTTVPFRCIDEINQGMDANNERRIFNLITKTTEERGNTQIFLLTPKLLPNLDFTPGSKIFFPYNGVGSIPHQKYSQSCHRFLEAAATPGCSRYLS